MRNLGYTVRFGLYYVDYEHIALSRSSLPRVVLPGRHGRIPSALAPFSLLLLPSTPPPRRKLQGEALAVDGRRRGPVWLVTAAGGGGGCSG
jgi:hypothetical protein